MLGPKTLTTGDYVVALKPTLGYEQQLYVSTGLTTDLGQLQVLAANSGVYTANVADNATLAAAPQELLCVLRDPVNCGPTDLVVSVTGTDQNDVIRTGTATLKVPGYSQFTERVFPRGYSFEVVPPVVGGLWKTITTVTVTNDAAASGTKIEVFGVPALGTFRKIGCKTVLNWDPKVAKPVSIQCGRDLSAFVKPGEIPVGACEVTAKIPTYSDGLSRVNGVRVTGLIKEIKEDKLDTMHVFFMGLVLTSKSNVGESQDPATLNAEAMYEDVGILLALGNGQ